MLADVGLLALRIEGSIAISIGIGEWVCGGGSCVAGRFEERIGADLGAGARITLATDTDARLSMDLTAGPAVAWIATSTDDRGSFRDHAVSAGDRPAVGLFGEVRAVVQVGPDVALHAGVRVRLLFAVATDASLEIVAEGLVGASWIAPM